MKFEIENRDKVVIVKTKIEKLDSLIAPELKSEFVLVNKNGSKNIVLDMSDTRYCDSSGLSAILVANRLCRDSEGTFVLCGLQDTVSKLITISQLDSVLKITPTANEAVDLVYMDEVERDVE
jgi:anti-sigma B factor antagonist